MFKYVFQFTLKSLFMMLLISCYSLSQETKFLSSKQWIDDLNYMVKILELKHPNPYYRVDKNKFEEMITEIKNAIPGSSDKEIVVDFLRLLSLLKDGHTGLITQGSRLVEFNHWFPVRYYKFSDGWFITNTDSANFDIIGSKVIKIGKLNIDEAINKIIPIVTADNIYGVYDMLPYYLSNGDYLEALDITENPAEVEITAKKNGKTKTIKFNSFKAELHSNWLKNPFDLPQTIRSKNYKPNPKFPNLLNIKKLNAKNYWFEHLVDKQTVYIQFNSVFNDKDEPFSSFTQRVLRYIRKNKVSIKNFVLDIRYNEGGNGNILLPFIHQLIQNEDLFDKIDFYTIIGRRTFSAAVIAIGELKRHTNCVFVGEPAGAPLNFYSDSRYFKLPNSKLLIYVSSLFFQLSFPANKDILFYPDVPVLTSSADMFNGIDPQLEVIFSGLARSVFDVCLKEGVEKAIDHFRKRKKKFDKFDWWKPKSEQEINNYGYNLVNENRLGDALKIFTLNTKLFPYSWNCWDSLGEIYLKLGDKINAIKFYKKSYQLNPNNKNAKIIIDKLNQN